MNLGAKLSYMRMVVCSWLGIQEKPQFALEPERPTSPADTRKAWERDFVPWNVAGETGEFTHILKRGTHTLSVTPARTP